MTRSEGKRISGNHYPHKSGEGDLACLALPSTLTHAAAVIVPVTHQPRKPGIKTEEFYLQTNFRTNSPASNPLPMIWVRPSSCLIWTNCLLNWSSGLQSTHYSSFSELLPAWSFRERSHPVIPLLAIPRAVIANWRLPSTPRTQEQNCTFMPHGRGSEWLITFPHAYPHGPASLAVRLWQATCSVLWIVSKSDNVIPGWDRVPLLCPLFPWHRDLEINVLNGFLIRWRRPSQPTVTHLTRISLHVLSHWDLGVCLVPQHTHDMTPVLQNSILSPHFGNVL